jgi:exodeoxyribonuclease VII large subunit
MTGTVELDPDGTHLLIRFSYREDLVAMVKELPGRRWDPKGKVWRVPASHVEQVFIALSRHLFDFAPEIPALLAGTLRAAPAPDAKPARAPTRQATLPLPTADAAATDDEPRALTVSALNARVRDGLRREFPDAFWVVGEVVDFDKSAGRQHRFFQLVEKANGHARPLAAVEVALFAAAAERLLPELARHDPPLALRDGIEIRVLVRVDLYPATGRYQIVVQDIDPSFTLGKLALTKEQILRELAQKGLADRNRSLGFPTPALRIGVLTSPDADGWNDFLRHAEEARVGFDVALFPIKVQGVELKPALLAGLAWFARHRESFDVLCIVRGGGSRTDLAWFDDREIALAVAQHPLKIVVGIGHQRDQSVLDAIAHSEKTPTAVAELLVRGVEAARGDVRERAARLHDAITGHIARLRTDLDHLARSLQRATGSRLARAHGDLAAAARDVAAGARMRLRDEGAALRAGAARIARAGERGVERAQAVLERHATRVRLLDPQRVLARGFTIVRGADGRVLPSAARVTENQTLRVQWRDGHADARVDHVHRQP